jgi:hypothetical protein
MVIQLAKNWQYLSYCPWTLPLIPRLDCRRSTVSVLSITTSSTPSGITAATPELLLKKPNAPKRGVLDLGKIPLKCFRTLIAEFAKYSVF